MGVDSKIKQVVDLRKPFDLAHAQAALLRLLSPVLVGFACCPLPLETIELLLLELYTLFSLHSTSFCMGSFTAQDQGSCNRSIAPWLLRSMLCMDERVKIDRVVVLSMTPPDPPFIFYLLKVDVDGELAPDSVHFRCCAFSIGLSGPSTVTGP